MGLGRSPADLSEKKNLVESGHFESRNAGRYSQSLWGGSGVWLGLFFLFLKSFSTGRQRAFFPWPQIGVKLDFSRPGMAPGGPERPPGAPRRPPGASRELQEPPGGPRRAQKGPNTTRESVSKNRLQECWRIPSKASKNGRKPMVFCRKSAGYLEIIGTPLAACSRPRGRFAAPAPPTRLSPRLPPSFLPFLSINEHPATRAGRPRPPAVRPV